MDNTNDSSIMGLTPKIVSIIVAVVVFACVLVPICSGLASGNGEGGVPGGENVDPVSELRLTYTEDKIPMMLVDAYINDEDGLTVEIYDSEQDYDDYNASYSITGITDDVIIFASDYISLFYQDGQIVISYIDGADTASYATVAVMEDGVGVGVNPNNLIPYTFLYYPSEDGEYANFSSYKFDSGNMFAIGSGYGLAFASKDGKFVGYSPYDVTTTIVKENGEVIGVEYSAIIGDGTGTQPDTGEEDEPLFPIAH